MADLVSGRYPQSFAPWAVWGQATNVNQSDIPVRSNAEILTLSGAIATGTGAASGVLNSVMVPVDQGMIVSKVTILVTNTAASTPTHQFAALYQGTGSAPALIGQSTDGTTAAIAANAPYTFTLTTPQLITNTNSPNGFIYVSFGFTSSAQPSLVTVAGPTIGAWGTMVPGTGWPLFFSATHGSAVGATAPSTIASASNQTNAPIVYLS